MKIYTKQGDKGITTLANGERVSKSHHRIEAIGNVDELNSWIGLLIDESIEEYSKNQLIQIQQTLFHINAHIAQYAPNDISIEQNILQQISSLEKDIDEMQKELPPLKHFIVYGGHIVVSHIHITRAISRRAERTLVTIENILPCMVMYLNRLNDYLFVLARYTAMKLGIAEKYWSS